MDSKEVGMYCQKTVIHLYPEAEIGNHENRMECGCNPSIVFMDAGMVVIHIKSVRVRYSDAFLELLKKICLN